MEFKRTERLPVDVVTRKREKLPGSASRDFKPVICPLRFSIGEDAAVQPGQNCRQCRIVNACSDRAIERHLVHEGQKGVFHVVHVAIAVHVLAIEIGDHCQNGRQASETIGRFRRPRPQDIALCRAWHSIPAHPRVRRPRQSDRVRRPPRTDATMEVVVVLPCMPAMAMPYFSRISSASISAR